MVLSIVSAPSNLGLRPPRAGSVPGTAKAPEALREAGIHGALGARDSGVVLPARYVDDDATRAEGPVRNEAAIVDHARRLANRIGEVLGRGETPLVLGGDCSILLGAGLALRGRGAGLIHLDGHTDFRHPGNSAHCASLAGEDLAVAVGLHRPSLSFIDEPRPYFSAETTAHLGCRDDDEHLAEATAVLGELITAREARASGAESAATRLARVADTGRGFWLQLDVDVLDPEWMPAVDSPDPGGLTPDEAAGLLRALAPGMIGLSVTVYDPDLDPDGAGARLIVELLAAGLAQKA